VKDIPLTPLHKTSFYVIVNIKVPLHERVIAEVGTITSLDMLFGHSECDLLTRTLIPTLTRSLICYEFNNRFQFYNNVVDVNVHSN